MTMIAEYTQLNMFNIRRVLESIDQELKDGSRELNAKFKPNDVWKTPEQANADFQAEADRIVKQAQGGIVGALISFLVVKLTQLHSSDVKISLCKVGNNEVRLVVDDASLERLLIAAMNCRFELAPEPPRPVESTNFNVTIPERSVVVNTTVPDTNVVVNTPEAVNNINVATPSPKPVQVVRDGDGKIIGLNPLPESLGTLVVG
jgi:hypothetical protein